MVDADAAVDGESDGESDDDIVDDGVDEGEGGCVVPIGDAVAPSEALPERETEGVWLAERDGDEEPHVVADVEAHVDAEGVVDTLVDAEKRAEVVGATVLAGDTLDETEVERLGVGPPEGDAKFVVGAADAEPDIDNDGDVLCELDVLGESESVVVPDAEGERVRDAAGDDDGDPQEDADSVDDGVGDSEGDAAPEGVGITVLGAAVGDMLDESDDEALVEREVVVVGVPVDCSDAVATIVVGTGDGDPDAEGDEDVLCEADADAHVDDDGVVVELSEGRVSALADTAEDAVVVL